MGIESSIAIVLFLSPGVLLRPYCQLEIRHALALNKPIILVHGAWFPNCKANHTPEPLASGFDDVQRRMRGLARSTSAPRTPKRRPTCNNCSISTSLSPFGEEVSDLLN